MLPSLFQTSFGLVVSPEMGSTFAVVIAGLVDVWNARRVVTAYITAGN